MLVSLTLSHQRAQGRPGARRPHGPPAEKNAGGRYHRFGGDIPAFPARMGYGLYALSLGTGILAPVARNTRRKHHELDTSSGVSGPHDFTVRFNAVRQPASTRPSQPASTFVTTRTPLFDEAGCAEISMISEKKKEKSFRSEALN